MSELSKIITKILNDADISNEEKNKKIMWIIAGRVQDYDLVEIIDHMNRVYFDDAQIF